MKKKSIWEDTVISKKLNSLEQDLETDILIIGGGITGISTAFYLKDQQVTLIDKGTIGSGVSAKTTGKLTFLQDQIYVDLSKLYNSEIAYQYYQSQKQAIDLVTRNIEKYHISCHLEKSASFVFTDSEKEIKNIEKIKDFFEQYHIPFKIKKSLPILFPCKYALEVEDCYVFNPLEYIQSLKDILLKSGVSIYENTRAIAVKKEEDYFLVQTENNQIKAKKVIICTHYPFFIVPFFTPFKTYVSKSYVVAGKTEKNEKYNAITNTDPTHSIRYYKDNSCYLLYSSVSHPNCEKLNYEENYHQILEQYNQYFKGEVAYIWSTHDVMTRDFMPYIGRIYGDDNFLLATGYNKWGMTNGSLAGKILSDIILGKTNPFETLVDPNRKMPFGGIKNGVVENFITGRRYIENKVKSNLSFYKDNVLVTRINGKKVGVYIDENNERHIVSNICPHMKCNLLFNNFDKTWDCPCHGSRFTINGDVVEGPSVYTIKVDKK